MAKNGKPYIVLLTNDTSDAKRKTHGSEIRIKLKSKTSDSSIGGTNQSSP